MSTPSVWLPKREKKKKKKSRTECKRGESVIFGIKTCAWLVIKACHGRKLMASAQEGRRQDAEDKLPGSGLCNHSGVRSSIWTEFVVISAVTKQPFCIHGRKHQNKVTDGDSGAVVDSTARLQQLRKKEKKKRRDKTNSIHCGSTDRLTQTLPPPGPRQSGWLRPSRWSAYRTSPRLETRSGPWRAWTGRCSHRWTRAPPCSPPPRKWKTGWARPQTPPSPEDRRKDAVRRAGVPQLMCSRAGPLPSWSPSWRSTASCCWSARFWWRLRCWHPSWSDGCRWCRSAPRASRPGTCGEEERRLNRGEDERGAAADSYGSPRLLGQEMGDSKLGQRLPRLDEAHLCFDETHLGHVLVGFEDPGRDLTKAPMTRQDTGPSTTQPAGWI